jgi:hypothetical protein
VELALAVDAEGLFLKKKELVQNKFNFMVIVGSTSF